MTVSWIINFKSIQHRNTVVRGRKHLTDPFPLLRSQPPTGPAEAAVLGRTLSYSSSVSPLHSPTSHSSHLLISLLLSIGVRVIGYFTHVRVELVEGKGQATRLSMSCTTVIHQLLSGTRKATAALSRHFVKPHPGLPG